MCCFVVTYNANGISHPIHLHGYDMYMMEMGMLNLNISKDEAIYQLMEYLDSDERKEIPTYPVNKDTIPLTAGGYAVSRIFTDNPGLYPPKLWNYPYFSKAIVEPADRAFF